MKSNTRWKRYDRNLGRRIVAFIKICLTDIINPKNDKREPEMTGDALSKRRFKIHLARYLSKRNAVQKRGD